MNSLNKSEKGFTLIEIMAVLIIVAILAAVSAPAYIKYVKSARAAEAQTAISAYYTALKVYYQKFGKYTSSPEELDIEVDEATLNSWTFSIGASENDLTTLQATSTENMPGGAGRVVTYDVKTGEWTGYGVDE